MYVQLSDALKHLGIRDVWASIAECTVPRPTRGTGYQLLCYKANECVLKETEY